MDKSNMSKEGLNLQETAKKPGISRREFLKIAALGGASALLGGLFKPTEKGIASSLGQNETSSKPTTKKEVKEQLTSDEILILANPAIQDKLGVAYRTTDWVNHTAIQTSIISTQEAETKSIKLVEDSRFTIEDGQNQEITSVANFNNRPAILYGNSQTGLYLRYVDYYGILKEMYLYKEFGYESISPHAYLNFSLDGTKLMLARGQDGALIIDTKVYNDDGSIKYLNDSTVSSFYNKFVAVEESSELIETTLGTDSIYFYNQTTGATEKKAMPMIGNYNMKSDIFATSEGKVYLFGFDHEQGAYLVDNSKFLADPENGQASIVSIPEWVFAICGNPKNSNEFYAFVRENYTFKFAKFSLDDPNNYTLIDIPDLPTFSWPILSTDSTGNIILTCFSGDDQNIRKLYYWNDTLSAWQEPSIEQAIEPVEKKVYLPNINKNVGTAEVPGIEVTPTPQPTTTETIQPTATATQKPKPRDFSVIMGK